MPSRTEPKSDRAFWSHFVYFIKIQKEKYRWALKLQVQGLRSKEILVLRVSMQPVYSFCA